MKDKDTIKKIINNIRTLAQIKGLKLGDIERKMGRSAGYLSRHPNIATLELIGVSNLLGVTVGDLITKDFGDMLIDAEIRKLEEQIGEIEKEIVELKKKKIAGNNVKPRAIYIGFDSHGCETHYECPVCGRHFGSWSLERNEAGNRYCPECKTELDGLE